MQRPLLSSLYIYGAFFCFGRAISPIHMCGPFLLASNPVVWSASGRDSGPALVGWGRRSPVHCPFAQLLTQYLVSSDCRIARCVPRQSD